MRVLESFTAGSGPVNLDRLVITANHVAVLDGSTAKGGNESDRASLTSALMDRLVDAVRSLPPDSSGVDLVNRMAAAARGFEDGKGFRANSAGAVYCDRRREVTVIADAWVGVDGKARFFGHRLEEHLAAVRAAFTELAVSTGTSVDAARESDPGRTVILPLLEREHEFRNSGVEGWSFAGLDGRSVPPGLVRTLAVPTTSRRLVLASDGYPSLGDDLEQAERRLRRSLAGDPLRIRHPATKAWRIGADSYDDRTFVALDVRI